MAEISLREYLEKVDALLKTGKSDEVILHTRQILKHNPKNVAASRYLGQALVRGSDYKEAEPVLRRVLSVYPDDVVAHTGLSDMNDRQGKGDEAIWHIERALEGAPNDSALIDRWRSLYQRYRKVEDPRFQLTTGAVARQYTRNGLYAQAIETLNTTLEKSPRRVDLRLLLAQTMWDAGMQVEGAETALDVLDMLPYCLEANRILTMLWLSEGRPSDAQRYLNQIQEVDPYQALQLAQNTAPDDEAFTLPELDYRRIAETQINTDQPDWLTEIDEEAASVSTEIGELEDEAFELDDELPQAFLTDLEAEDAPPLVTRPKTGMTGLLAALDQPQDAGDEEAADELPVSGELPDWLMESAPQEASTDTPTSLEADPLAWLEDGGTELSDEASALTEDFETIQKQTGSLDWLEAPAEQEVPDFFGDADFAETMSDIEDDEEHNPLAWLEASGVELLDESEMPPPSSLIDEEEMVYSDPEQINPLAWLESSGVELVEEEVNTPDALFEAPAQPKSTGNDSLAWLEAESPEPENADSQTIRGSVSDTLDWLDEAEAEELPPSGFLNTPVPSSADADSLDWLQDDSILDEMLDIEELSDTGGLPSADTSSTPDFFAGMDGVTDRLPGSAASNSEFAGTGGQNEMSDEKNDLEPQSDDSELSSFEWLNDEPEVEDSPQASTSDLDWMTEIPDEQPECSMKKTGNLRASHPQRAGQTGYLRKRARSATSLAG
jgi:tetratricopeptide (TPR) repeat protein